LVCGEQNSKKKKEKTMIYFIIPKKYNNPMITKRIAIKIGAA